MGTLGLLEVALVSAVVLENGVSASFNLELGRIGAS
jgi:hypothetical protein